MLMEMPKGTITHTNLLVIICTPFLRTHPSLIFPTLFLSRLPTHTTTNDDNDDMLNNLVSSKEPKATVADVLGSLPMLIVDDSVSILKMTKRAILNSHASMAFIEAKNGQEAYDQVVAVGNTFSLVVTDIQMPICDGFEFTRMVRQLEQDKNLPPKIIIGISANDQEKISMEAKESGMDGFMHKPFKLTTLMEVIADISNRRKKVINICFYRTNKNVSRYFYHIVFGVI